MLAVRNRAIDGRGLSPPRSAALLAAPDLHSLLLAGLPALRKSGPLYRCELTSTRRDATSLMGRFRTHAPRAGYLSKRQTVAGRRAQHRLAWRAIQRRVRPGEAHRTGRGLVVGRPCVGPLKRRECRDYCDYHRNGEKYDGGAVAIPQRQVTLRRTWARAV